MSHEGGLGGCDVDVEFDIALDLILDGLERTVGQSTIGSEPAWWRMTYMVRAQAVRGYRELVEELGGDPARLLNAAGISETVFDRPDALVDFGAVVGLLGGSAHALACPDPGSSPG